MARVPLHELQPHDGRSVTPGGRAWWRGRLVQVLATGGLAEDRWATVAPVR